MAKTHSTNIDPHQAWFHGEVERALAKGQRGEARFTPHDEVFEHLKCYARQQAEFAKNRTEHAHHGDGQLA